MISDTPEVTTMIEKMAHSYNNYKKDQWQITLRKCGLHGLVIAVRVYCILQNLAPPYMCPEPTFVQFFYVLNLMLVNVKWASVAQQLVHDVSKKDVYCLFEALIYKQCMVHI